jgi:hypothetical protein
MNWSFCAAVRPSTGPSSNSSPGGAGGSNFEHFRQKTIVAVITVRIKNFLLIFEGMIHIDTKIVNALD